LNNFESISVLIIAKKLKNARVIYKNKAVTIENKTILNEYAFGVPNELDAEGVYAEKEKLFYADRYGGPGIGHHGGSGRCGSTGFYQIKGIGRTPLIGKMADENDFWHSHGSIALADAIQEAIWSEAFSTVLPYGVVPIAAIIINNSKCWIENADGSKSTAPRAYVIREVSFRPAHFMRATFYKNIHLPAATDVERVNRAINFLHLELPQAEGEMTVNKMEILYAGLLELLRRISKQCASSQLSRLAHGYLNSSNIALDGRWIDFGTCDFLPTYENTKTCGSPRRFATLWNQQDFVQPLVHNLTYFINKYFLFDSKKDYLTAPSIINYFYARYRNDHYFEILGALGLPRELVDNYLKSEKLDFVNFISAIIRDVSRSVELPDDGNIETLGPNKLYVSSQKLVAVARVLHTQRTSKAQGCHRIFSPEERIFEDFIFRLSTDRVHSGVSVSSIYKLLLIGSSKLAKNIPELYRRNMRNDNIRIASIIDNEEISEEISRKVNRIKDQCKVLFHKPKKMCALIAVQSGVLIWYETARDVFLIENDNSVSAPTTFDNMHPSHQRMVLDLWDKNFIGELTM
jgi:Protein adenylyltransferase SelO